MSNERSTSKVRYLGDFEPESVPTTQEAVVVPVVQGRARLGVTFLDGALDARAKAVRKNVGKNKTTIGYKYYADIGMLVCMGPVTRLLEIYEADELAWSGDVQDSGAGYADISVDGIGPARFRFGTANQTQDGYIYSAANHPGYKYQAVIEFSRQYFGRDTTSARSIEVVVERLPDVPDSIKEIDGRANPAGALYEVLTNEVWGLGMSADLLDLSSFEEVAALLSADGYGMSYVWNSDEDAPAVAEEIMDSFSGGLRWDPALRQYRLVQSYRLPDDPGSLLEISAAECSALPSTTMTAWCATPGEIRLDYTDADDEYEEKQILKVSNASIIVNGRKEMATYAYDEVDNQALALKMAMQVLASKTLPTAEGEFEAMTRTVDGLAVGDWFYLELWPGNGYTLCYCTRREDGGAYSRDVTIGYEVYLSAWSYSGASGGSTYTRPDEPTYEPESHLFQRILEAPRFMAESAVEALVLVGRAHALMTGFAAYSSLDGGTTYTAATLTEGDLSGFGLPVELAGDPGTGDSIELEVLNSDYTEFESVTSAQQSLGELLLFVEDEIISLGDLDYGTSLVCTNVLRGFGDTKPASHSAGTQGLIAYASQLYSIDPTPNATIERLFKLPAQTFIDEQDLADVTPLAFQGENRRLAPLNLSGLRVGTEALTLPSHHQNFVDTELAGTFEQGADILFEVTRKGWADLGFAEAAFYDPADLKTVIDITDDAGTVLDTVEGTGTQLTVTAPAEETHVYAVIKTRTTLPNSSTAIDSRITFKVGITLTAPAG